MNDQHLSELIQSRSENSFSGYIYAYRIRTERWVKVGYTKNHSRTRMEHYSETHNLVVDSKSLKQVRLPNGVDSYMVELVLHQHMEQSGFQRPLADVGVQEVFSFPANYGSYEDVIMFLAAYLEELLNVPSAFLAPPPRTERELEWRDRSMAELREELREREANQKKVLRDMALHREMELQREQKAEEIKQQFRDAPGFWAKLGAAADLVNEACERARIREEEQSQKGKLIEEDPFNPDSPLYVAPMTEEEIKRLPFA